MTQDMQQLLANGIEVAVQLLAFVLLLGVACFLDRMYDKTPEHAEPVRRKLPKFKNRAMLS